VLALAASPGSLLGQANSRPPGQISYQGYLTDANGVPLASTTPKNYTVLFKIWNNSTSGGAGNLLWGEQQVVTVDRGYFTVSLGAGSPISGVFSTNDLSSLFNASDASIRYLGMTVQGLSGVDSELTPRLRLTTSPYAMLAASATSLAGPSAAANGLVVQNGLVVDGANQNSGPLNTNNALTFGSGGGEGIASQRSATPAGLQSDLALFTAGRPRLTVLNNGYVGIGATNPQADLHVAGIIQARPQTTTDGYVALQPGSGGSAGYFEWWAPNTGQANSRIAYMGFNSGGNNNLNLTLEHGANYSITGGNVGIGNISPAYPLSFDSTFGDKLSLQGAAGLYYGFGVMSGQLQIHTDASTSDVLFGYGTSGNFVETMRIKGNGVVGIGTKTPTYALTLKTPTSTYGFVHTDGTVQLGSYVNGTGGWLGTLSDHPLSFFVNGGGASMEIAANGYVGIGTTTPRAPLDVAVKLTGYAGSFMRLGYTGTPSLALTTGYVTTDNPSIIATGDILSGAIIIASDARIKKVGGRSDGRADLSKLMEIEVTDYTMVDTVTQGGRSYKKVVAQQVEGVYPQAVSRTTGVVPDIYAKADANGGLIALATPLKSALKLGDKVRLVNEQGSDLHEVTEVRSGGFRVKDPINGPVFVYGREVSDFRSVDYDAISMLNVSATQELARQLAAEQGEVAKLRAENQSLAAKLGAIEARFARLEKARDGSEEDKELVALKRK